MAVNLQNAAGQPACVGLMAALTTPGTVRWVDVPRDASGGGGMSALHALVGLAAALTSADSDGRVVVDAAAHTVKFVLLNAAALFGKVRSPAQTLGQMETKCTGAECCQRTSYRFTCLKRHRVM